MILCIIKCCFYFVFKECFFLFFLVCINERVVYKFFLDVLRYNINVFKKKKDKYLFYDNYCSNSL